MIFPSQGSSFREVLVPKQSSSGRQQLLVLVVSSERQSDAADGVRVVFSKCRVHHSEGEIKIGDWVGELQNRRNASWKEAGLGHKG